MVGRTGPVNLGKDVGNAYEWSLGQAIGANSVLFSGPIPLPGTEAFVNACFNPLPFMSLMKS